MRLEEVDEKYSFKGRTRSLVSALQKNGFLVTPSPAKYQNGTYHIAREGRDSGKIIAFEIPFDETQSRRLIVYDAPSNPELRRFARAYKG